MTEDERQDLLELKSFLEQAIIHTEEELTTFPIQGSMEDYRFLIAKAVMYRETLKKIKVELETDRNDE